MINNLKANIKANTKKAILNGGPIDEIVISLNRTVEIKFNKGHRIISSNVTPDYLEKCLNDYLKLRTENPDKLQDKQIGIVNNGLTEIQLKKYKNKIVKVFYDLFWLKSPDNYSNENKD